MCWDVFDYLEKPAAQTLAGQVARILRPGGVALAFFSTAPPRPEHALYTKRVIVDETTVEHRDYPAARGKQTPQLNRDIIRMFEPLRVSEQFLLKMNVCEMLFRKPSP